MTTNGGMARCKQSLLQMATVFSNVSRACEVLDYSRQQFDEMRRSFQTYERKARSAGCWVRQDHIPSGCRQTLHYFVTAGGLLDLDQRSDQRLKHYYGE